MNILVVDDDPVARRVVQALLAERGHRVDACASGEEALALFAHGAHAVVVTDWMMPGIDGLELVRRIRAEPGARYTYLVVLTARDEQGSALSALDAGADDLLPKPVRKEELLGRLRVAERIIGLQERLLAGNRELLTVNQRMKRALEAAVAVQRSLLPARPPEVDGIRFAWRALPCDELGGDTLNLIQLDPRSIAFYVLDVSGHGVSSALLAVQVHRLLSGGGAGSMLRDDQGRPVPPLALLHALNARFPVQVDAPQYFTIAYGLLDVVEHRAVIGCAGHPGPLVLRADGGSEQLRTPSHPIGWFEGDEAEFAQVEVVLGPGDRVVLYSDGAIECPDPDNTPFGADRLERSFSRRHALPLLEAIDETLADLAGWRRHAPQADDISLLGIERLAQP